MKMNDSKHNCKKCLGATQPDLIQNVSYSPKLEA